MSRKQYDMQDTETSSLRITDEIQQEYDIKYSNEDIQWGDYWQDKTTRNTHQGSGFLAEAVLVDILQLFK